LPGVERGGSLANENRARNKALHEPFGGEQPLPLWQVFDARGHDEILAPISAPLLRGGDRNLH
jgi:hypothetical protein